MNQDVTGSKTAQCTSTLSPPGAFSSVDRLGHKTTVKKFGRNKTMPTVFSDHEVELEVNVEIYSCLEMKQYS